MIKSGPEQNFSRDTHVNIGVSWIDYIKQLHIRTLLSSLDLYGRLYSIFVPFEIVYVLRELVIHLLQSSSLYWSLHQCIWHDVAVLLSAALIEAILRVIKCESSDECFVRLRPFSRENCFIVTLISRFLKAL